MNSESVKGYKIMQAVCLSNDRGFALAHNPNAVQPWVSWRFTDTGGARDYYWGRYYDNKQSALQNFEKRVGEYRGDYPALTEKYNYLAAAEMSEEQNYNMIDGVPNNTAKPSIIEHLRQFQPQPAERGDAPDRPAEIQR